MIVQQNPGKNANLPEDNSSKEKKPRDMIKELTNFLLNEKVYKSEYQKAIDDLFKKESTNVDINDLLSIYPIDDLQKKILKTLRNNIHRFKKVNFAYKKTNIFNYYFIINKYSLTMATTDRIYSTADLMFNLKGKINDNLTTLVQYSNINKIGITSNDLYEVKKNNPVLSCIIEDLNPAIFIYSLKETTNFIEDQSKTWKFKSFDLEYIYKSNSSRDAIAISKEVMDDEGISEAIVNLKKIYSEKNRFKFSIKEIKNSGLIYLDLKYKPTVYKPAVLEFKKQLQCNYYVSLSFNFDNYKQLNNLVFIEMLYLTDFRNINVFLENLYYYYCVLGNEEMFDTELEENYIKIMKMGFFINFIKKHINLMKSIIFNFYNSFKRKLNVDKIRKIQIDIHKYKISNILIKVILKDEIDKLIDEIDKFLGKTLSITRSYWEKALYYKQYLEIMDVYKLEKILGTIFSICNILVAPRKNQEKRIENIAEEIKKLLVTIYEATLDNESPGILNEILSPFSLFGYIYDYDNELAKKIEALFNQNQKIAKDEMDLSKENAIKKAKKERAIYIKNKLNEIQDQFLQKKIQRENLDQDLKKLITEEEFVKLLGGNENESTAESSSAARRRRYFRRSLGRRRNVDDEEEEIFNRGPVENLVDAEEEKKEEE